MTGRAVKCRLVDALLAALVVCGVYSMLLEVNVYIARPKAVGLSMTNFLYRIHSLSVGLLL